jgi:2-polyprenyl-3-methyl-5-hydroxy-6-metoxy-1,4-benzoquinol methylase
MPCEINCLNNLFPLNNINDAFFRGRYKEVWRQIIPAGLTEAETDFIEELASLKPGAKVLDIMSGYGRHSLELAKRGYQVTSLDIETDYISEINTKAKEASLSIHTIEGSVMENLPVGNFDAIICMGNSFAFFREEDVKTLLAKLASILKPGGTLIINSWMIAEIAIRHFKDKEWHEMDGCRYLIANQYHTDPTRIESIHTIIDNEGNIEEIKGVDYIFTLRELRLLLENEGFLAPLVYSTPRKRPFRLGDGKAYIVSKRAG